MLTALQTPREHCTHNELLKAVSVDCFCLEAIYKKDPGESELRQGGLHSVLRAALMFSPQQQVKRMT